MNTNELKNLIKECLLEIYEENQVLDEKAPPKFPKKLYHKIKAQYPKEPEKAYATMWALHKKGKIKNEMWIGW